MKSKRKAQSIPDIIGVLLIIVALVSAGGLYYIGSEYTKITDTIVSVDAYISDFRIERNPTTNEITVSISVTIENPSNLDLEIYRVEYQTFVDRSTKTITSSDRYIGSGSTNDNNGTVLANSMREVQITHMIQPDNSLYNERLEYALDGDSTLWAYTGGFLWFRISDYPDVSTKLGIGFQEEVVVQNA